MNDRCLVCDVALSESFLFMKRRFDGYPMGLDLYRCPSCGFVQTCPMPRIDQLMEHEYTSDYTAYGNEWEKASSITARKRLSLVLRHADRECLKPGARLLDVGCSTGWFLKAAQAHGFVVSGIELSSYATQKANRLLGAEIVRDVLFENAPFGESEFDIIYSNQVIEHAVDPSAFVAMAARCLKPNGLLVLGTPNIDSIPARKLGGNWGNMRKPDHVVFFSPVSLPCLLEKHGFSVQKIYWTGTPVFGKTHYQDFVDRNINSDNKRRMALGEGATSLQRIKRFLLRNRMLSSMTTFWIHHLRIGDTILAVSRKRRHA